MYFYEGFHFAGMHLVWWIIWIALILWIFATPYEIPGERRKTESPLDHLKKRYAEGSITKEDYEERKTVLMKDNAR